MKKIQFPVDEVVVAGNSVVVVPAICERGSFRLRELLLADPDVSRYFMVDDIKVGKNSQFCSDASVPASFFAKAERQEGLYCDTLPRGLRFGLAVTNLSDQARTFKGVMSGDLVDLDHNERVARLPTDRFILGLGTIMVSPKTKLTVRTQAHVVFKPDTMVIPEHVLDGVRVKAMRVVGEDMFAGADDELGMLVSGQVKLKTSPTMQISDWICIEVENETDAPKLFCGTVVGASPF